LRYNKEVLGDWLLAIGAYNCGLNCMKEALEEAGLSDFWDLASGGFLPDETRRYVPAFLAVAYIAENAKAYDITLPPPKDWRWQQVVVEGQANLQLLAEAAGIDLELLALGNAGLIHGVTPPTEYAYHLKVPDIYTDVIRRSLQGVHLDRFFLHEIKTGDTLYALSNHFGVPVDLIMHYNPGVKPRFLQINAKLLIPVLDRETSRPVLKLGSEAE
jgi:membrane-bound lytic murein transglycosylase D